MFKEIARIFSVEELRKKILFTLFLLALCRIGAYIPVPGINSEAAVNLFKSLTGSGNNFFQLMDIFSGGAFAQMTITALGVMPYITASIIMQVLMALLPSIQREIKENHEAGKRKLGKWTRLLTIGLAFFQAGLLSKYALQLNAGGTAGLIVDEIFNVRFLGFPWLFYLIIMFTMTAGTVLLMWIGEQISDRGIGNGMSLIITIGILSSMPMIFRSIVRQLNLESQEGGQLSFVSLAVLICVFVAIIIGAILVIQGQRKIPVEYARKTVGHSPARANTAYIPLKINYAGVIPVIFASSVLMLPATMGQFLGKESFLGKVSVMITPGSLGYGILYVALIIFFTYFWTATQFHPEQIASEMKKNGAFIPGVRQGQPTHDYLEATMNRITFIGAIFLALIAILPTLVSKVLRVDPSITHFFGGTSLLILVGVVLDTMKQVESHLIMKRYDGFIRRGKSKF